MLTDRSTEYCGNPEHHEYELYLAVEDIDRSQTKTKSPQTNDHIKAAGVLARRRCRLSLTPSRLQGTKSSLPEHIGQQTRPLQKGTVCQIKYKLLPVCNRLLTEPDGQTASPPHGNVILCPIGHPPLRPRDMMMTIGVDFITHHNEAIDMLMKNSTRIWMTSILVATAVPITEEAKTQTVTFDPTNPTASGYTMVFDDEFKGRSLDRTKWSPSWAWGTGLSRTYPNDEALPVNISVRNGRANFAVTKGPTPAGRRYGTAAATTYGKFAQAYGYWEAAIKMPTNAHGIWPAFWLIPADFSWPPEIDVMEWLGVQPTVVHMTLHYGTDNKSVGSSPTLPNFNAGFHKLGMLWTPTSVTWYVDGVQEFSTTVGVPTKKMYIILNNDTGGWNNNVVDSTTVFPAILKVDYMRVYAPPGDQQALK